MTETVTAPQDEATEAESTETATPAKAPVSTADKISKALAKDMDGTTHPAFIKWIADNGGPELDPASVLATQSLYNVFRQTEEFKTAKEALPKGTSTAAEKPMPKTPEEARKALEDHQKQVERREAAARRADERAAKIQELLAQMAGEDSGEEASAEAEEPATDEDVQEAF